MSLIKRIEAATGPDRELDAAIQRALGDGSGHHWFADMNGKWVCDYMAPEFTASIDAAMTLAGDDCFRVERHPMYGVYAYVGDHDAYAETPALALCLAALRARELSAMEGRA